MRNSTRFIIPTFLFILVFAFAFTVSVSTPQNAGACVAPCDCTLPNGCHGAYVNVPGGRICGTDQCVIPGTCDPYPPCGIR